MSHADRLETASPILVVAAFAKYANARFEICEADFSFTRHSPHKLKGIEIVPQISKLIPALFLFLLSCVAHFDAKKSTIPTGYTCENSTRRAPPGSRTLDNLIKSQVLYQLS